MTSTTQSLPVLTGSDKQIAWASKIRAEVLRTLDAELTRYEQATGQSRETQPAIMGAWAKLTSYDSAAWWIDSRSQTAKQLLQSCLQVA